MRFLRPETPRQLLITAISVLTVGCLLPAALWLLIGSLTPPQAPTLVRVRYSGDQKWQAPDLNPHHAAALNELQATVPLSETAGASATLPLTTTSPPATGAAMVMVDLLVLRDGPGAAYLPLQQLSYGRLLHVIGQYGSWYHVVTEEQVVGWVERSLISTTTSEAHIPVVSAIPDPAPPLVATLVSTTTGVNLRPRPSLNTTPLHVLTPDQTSSLRLLTRFNGWMEVQTADGTAGWVSAELLATDAYVVRRVPMLTAAPQALEAVRLARQYVDYPYVWGAASPRVGFDCSGLVKFVYARLGVELPHSSAAQWRTAFGTKIYDQHLLLPGDVIFFENTYKPGISHVGIYAGDRLIIQAISETVGVQVSSLDEPYWAARYVGAIRPFP